MSRRSRTFRVLAAAGLLLVADALPATATPHNAGRPVYITNDGVDQAPCDTGDGPCAHSIAIYAAGPTGTLTQVGGPVRTGLGATGIVFAPDGSRAYVASSEEESVYTYSVRADGELVKLGDPVATGAGGPWGIAISPSGKTVYTTDIDTARLTAFTVHPDGTIARIGDAVPTIDTPKDVAVSPDGRFLFVSHGSPESPTRDSIESFALRPDGTIGDSPVDTEESGVTGAEIGITPDGRFLFVATMLSNAVYGFRIGSDGTLDPVPGRYLSTPQTPEGVSVSPDGRRLYVATTATRPAQNPQLDGVWTVAIGADGAMSIVGRHTQAGLAPVSLTVTPDGRHLVASDNGDGGVTKPGAVASMNLDPATGTPTLVRPLYPSLGLVPVFRSVGVLPNQGPTAAFSAQGHRTVAFDATASADHDGQIARYDWDFGDGTVLADGGPYPVHTFANPGTYRVTLTVTDNEGCSTELVFTGHSAYCNGSAAARAFRSVNTGP